MLDQNFFASQLPQLRDSYAKEHGDAAVQVELLLHHGLVYRTDSEIRAGEQYLSFEYTVENTKRQALIPYSSVVAINLTPARQSHRRVTGLVP